MIARTATAFRLSSLILVMATGGCATLPRSGPTAIEVKHAAAKDPMLPMRIVDLGSEMVAAAAEAPDKAMLSTLAVAPGPVDRVGPGDVLQVTVFEVGARLFSGGALEPSGGGTLAPSAGGQVMPALTVDRDGFVAFPYLGRLMVGGMTADQVAHEIEARLVGFSQHAQVLVAVRENVTNTVFVMGTVKTPGRLRLTLTRERLLDAIAEAGGATGPPSDMVVRVTRGTLSAETQLDLIRAAGPDDLILLPGDRIELLSRPRSFTVFGATDKVSEIPFQTPTMTLAQAVARAGGPSDRQADASAVFVFRYVEGSGTAPDAVIYRLNMLRPESYFLAQRFEMRGGDVIYIANARSNQAAKLVQIINQLFSPLFTVRELAR
ncbi:MAG: polysaccharide biosynthesis/export family protein [Pseudorhodoplanes sp.]